MSAGDLLLLSTIPLFGATLAVAQLWHDWNERNGKDTDIRRTRLAIAVHRALLREWRLVRSAYYLCRLRANLYRYVPARKRP